MTLLASERIPRVQWISWVKDADSCQVCDWIMKRNIGGGMTPEGYWYHENDSVDSKEYPKRSILFEFDSESPIIKQSYSYITFVINLKTQKPSKDNFTRLWV